ncbi:phage holin family protein [Actinomadura sp. NPDC048394]|uniref:phage holin family protein n=1 Tax=Actinomadura sp. NPDC048394 TaxID=3158223 RepID=UPI0033CFB98A
MPRRDWPSRIDELSGVVVVGIAIAGGGAIVLALLFFAVVAVAGIVHGLLPYWRYILAAFGLLVVLPMAVTGVKEAARARKRRLNPPPARRRESAYSEPSAPPPAGGADPVPPWPSSSGGRPIVRSSGTSINWHTSTVYGCRRCGHNWTSHGRGEGSCSVEGPPYTTQTTVGWEGDIVQTESGTPCGCSRYEGIEPP